MSGCIVQQRVWCFDMAIVLNVGDPHAVPEELDDCRALAGYILDVARRERVDRVHFAGDMHHTHALVHIGVVLFWKEFFRDLLTAGFKVSAQVGNHDRAGDGSAQAHALLSYPEITVINEPLVLDGVLYLPYYDDNDEFVAACRRYSECSVAFVHQTFNGATYENGIYAQDGVDPNLIPQETIISGHIHTPQKFGKVWYIGAPRWRTASDANVARAIWITEHADDGRVVNCRSFDTGGVCRRLFRFVETPDQLIQLPSDLRLGQDRVMVDLRDPTEFIEARKVVWTTAGAQYRTFRTDRAAPKVRESDGIDQAFDRFLGVYSPRNGTERTKLQQMARERVFGR